MLFAGGPVQPFGGARAQFFQSLEKLASRPGYPRLCGTDEYTLSNLKFATAVEPGNLELISYRKRREELRAQGLRTLPSTIGLDKRIHPFLRTREPAVVQAARGHDAATAPDEVSVFAALRQWNNGFK
jgi:hydroxyacylglutathione hydrolase